MFLRNTGDILVIFWYFSVFHSPKGSWNTEKNTKKLLEYPPVFHKNPWYNW